MQCLPGCFPGRAIREDFLSHPAQTCLLPWYKWHPPRVGAGFGWPAVGLSVHPGSCSRDTSKCYRCIIKFSDSTLLAKPRINSSHMYFCCGKTITNVFHHSSLVYLSSSLHFYQVIDFYSWKIKLVFLAQKHSIPSVQPLFEQSSFWASLVPQKQTALSPMWQQFKQQSNTNC